MTKHQNELQSEIRAQKARYCIRNSDIAFELGICPKTANKYVDDVSKMPLGLFTELVKYLKLNEVTVTNYIMEGRTI